MSFEVKMKNKNGSPMSVIVTALAFLLLVVCFCQTTEDVFLLEVEPYRRVKSFEYVGDESKCPLLEKDFMRAARSIVDLNGLDDGRFWIRAADFSVINYF
jgi:hypothetical protein